MQDMAFKNIKDIHAAALELGKRQPKFLEAITICGLPKIRKSDSGFKALFKIIVGQQLSTASAASIWKKLEDNNLTEINSILLIDVSQLRALGLSSAKVSYVKGLAKANVKFDLFKEKTNVEIIDELIAIRGIGLWTVKIYLMFSLRRSDVFASGDLALQEGARILFGMNNRPSSNELDLLAERWKPFRTIAAMIIWNYYDYTKKRE